MWRFRGDRLDVGRGHIDGDGLELAGAFWAESVEEVAERRGVLALVGPDHPLRNVVDNDGDVLVVGGRVGQLVDADVFEVFEEKTRISVSRHHALDDSADEVRHAMRMVSATIVWLACWAR